MTRRYLHVLPLMQKIRKICFMRIELTRCQYLIIIIENMYIDFVIRTLIVIFMYWKTLGVAFVRLRNNIVPCFVLNLYCLILFVEICKLYDVHLTFIVWCSMKFFFYRTTPEITFIFFRSMMKIFSNFLVIPSIEICKLFFLSLYY